MSMWRFIDHRGDLRDVSQLEKHYPLGGFTDRQTAIDWAIRNIGLVLVCGTERSIRARLREATTPAKALGATLQLLAGSTKTRAALSYFGTNWEHFVFSSGTNAAQHLAIRSVQRSFQDAPNLLRHTVEPGVLSSDPDLGSVFHQAKGIGEKVAVADIVGILPPALKERAIILEASRAHSRLVIRHLGSGFKVFDTRWAAAAIGRDMEDQPDVKYGCWTAQPYRSAAETMQVTADEIDAVVENPYTGGRHRSRYRRLIVPITGRSERIFLLGCSVIDPSINLRSKSG
jgi:hypothetical protein